MKKLIIIFFSLAFIASNCKKEGEDCHLKILIKNNSSNDIMYGWNIQNTSGDCILDVSIIRPNEIYELRKNNCWENELANGQPEEIYIVDPIHHNTPQIFYNCDSIEIKNKILKHYSVTLEDLKKSDFTITYP